MGQSCLSSPTIYYLMILNEATSAILQVLAFSLIPFIVYLFRKKPRKGFFAYLGLYPTTTKAALYALASTLIFIVGGLGVTLISKDISAVLHAPGTVTHKLGELGIGPSAILLLLILAGIKTSLSEEILFRGFIGKRLMSLLGFQWGNFLQALLFGLLHIVMFWALMGAVWPFLIYTFLLSGIGAYVIGIINEKVGNGSIFPGWISHGVGNAVSYFLIAFVM